MTVNVTVADSTISNPPTFGPDDPTLPGPRRPAGRAVSSPPASVVGAGTRADLPATGSSIRDLVPLALALLAAGALLRRPRRNDI